MLNVWLGASVVAFAMSAISANGASGTRSVGHPTPTGSLTASPRKVAQEIFDEAKDLEDDERTSILRWAIISEAKERRNAMIDLASKERTVVTVINDYDHDSWLFNCQTGTIDLRTGKLKPHDPADTITTISPVVYDPEGGVPAVDRVPQ